MRIVYTTASYKKRVVSSVITIALGLVLVLWPTEVLNYMVKLIGAVFFVIGVISLVMSYQNREERAAMGLSSFSGIGSVILGIVLWAMSDFFTSMLMWLFGLLLLIAGIGQMVTLLTARRMGSLPGVAYVFPILILIAGLVSFLDPFSAKESLVMFFGCVVIFAGVTNLINQYSINKLRKRMEEEEQRRRLEEGQEVEDADYLYVMDQGQVALQGSPDAIWHQANRLKELGVTLPFDKELLCLLRQGGMDIPMEIQDGRALEEFLMQSGPGNIEQDN